MRLGFGRCHSMHSSLASRTVPMSIIYKTQTVGKLGVVAVVVVAVVPIKNEQSQRNHKTNHKIHNKTKFYIYKTFSPTPLLTRKDQKSLCIYMLKAEDSGYCNPQ